MKSHQNLYKKLIQVYLDTQIVHWRFHSKSTLETHDKLGEFYKKLSDYIDEYVETQMTLGGIRVDAFELEARSKELISSLNHEYLRDSLILLRQYLTESKLSPEFDDWKGRLVSELTHYIYILSCDCVNRRIVDQSIKSELEKVLNYVLNK